MYGLQNGTTDMMSMAEVTKLMTLAMQVLWAIILIGWIFQAILAGSLARQKGYSGTAGFFIALLLPLAGLIYQAGRPISQEMEDERQRALAGRIGKAIRKSAHHPEKAEEEKASVRRKFKED